MQEWKEIADGLERVKVENGFIYRVRTTRSYPQVGMEYRAFFVGYSHRLDEIDSIDKSLE